MKKSRKILIITCIILSISIYATILIAWMELTKDAVLHPEKLPINEAHIILFDKNDNEVESGNYVSIEKISPNIVNAFIAIEDKRFYRHHGIDIFRIVGAAMANMKSGKIEQGGSTITCQLVKNTHLSGKKSLKRKVQEGKIALELEKNYTKQEILEMYLNILYFGNGIYGIKDACNTLYGKDPDNVSPIEAASLAATIANPNKYSILRDRDSNHKRTRLVLDEMRRCDRISEKEYRAALNGEIVLNYDNSHNNYYKNYRKLAIYEAQKSLSLSGKELNKGGYQIYTYMDINAQKLLSDALFSDEIESNREFLLAENHSHGIIAYASTVDNPTLRRQPGSIIKPFLYATSIDAGNILPDTPILDEPININGYHPSNYHNKYDGWISVRDALSRSSNAVSVKIIKDLGIDKAHYFIQKFGIPLSEKDKNLSLALGGTTYGSTSSEIAGGYMTLAMNGFYRPISSIRKITDNKGHVLYMQDSRYEKVIGSDSAYLTTEMLNECASTGTAKQLRYLGFPIAAKTGTVAGSNGNSDAWCAGYTSSHTFVCHYSAPDKSTLPDSVTGGNQPAKMTRNVLRAIYGKNAPSEFIKPTNMRKIKINTFMKENYHKLTSTWDGNAGGSESIYATEAYRLEKVDPNLLLLQDLRITIDKSVVRVSFLALPTVEYFVTLNGQKCFLFHGEYIAPKTRFPLAKLQIECTMKGKTTFKRSEIIRT